MARDGNGGLSMKRNIGKVFAIGLMVIVFALSAMGCGAAEKGDEAYEIGDIYDNGTGSTSESLSDVTSDMENPQGQDTERKIIENIELTVETKEFDAFMKNINEQVANLGGYVERSNVHGREMDSLDERSANMVIRIPADNTPKFSEYVSENGVVVSRAVNTEDVTLQYVDTESRLSALRAEKEALEKLLKIYLSLFLFSLLFP